MKDILNKIKKCIEETYSITTEISPKYLHKYNILIKSQKYDINISVCQAKESHYLYGKYKFVLFFDYEANKKYRSELNFHCGGYSGGYDENNYSNIKKFLNHWFEEKKEKQLSIFDYLERGSNCE